MKHFITWLLVASPAWAQWIVHDPANTAVNTAIHAGQTANHLEILRQWALQLENLNRQLQQFESMLAEERRIRAVLGNPSVAGAELALADVGASAAAHEVSATAAAVRRLADAAISLKYTADGIYPALENRTAVHQEFPRQESLYRRFATIERLAELAAARQADTASRTEILQADLSVTLGQLRTAATQAEVDKLNVKVAALNGQLALLAAQRNGEVEKLTAQHILNENQAAKERQDLLETQMAEERQTFSAVAAWQQSVRLTPVDYTR